MLQNEENGILKHLFVLVELFFTSQQHMTKQAYF